MNLGTIRLIALIATALPAAAPAQDRPSFAGEWTRVDSAPAAPTRAATGDAAFRTGDMGSGWGSPLTITQTTDSLIVSFVHFSTYDLQPRLRYAYALDGSESRNAIMIGHGEYPQRSRVTWNGATLVITTAHRAPPGVGGAGGAIETRQALSLGPDNTLVIETTRPGAAGPNVVRTTYTKR